MTFLDFLSPVRRQPLQWIGVFLGSIALLIGLYFILPPIEKHTIFFSVKPVASAEKSFLNDGVESAEKIAEMISGWAKDPNFQQDVIKESGVKISGLKKKMAARKQNRLNVFWTLKLSGAERQNGELLITSIKKLLTEKIKDINANSVIPINITTPHVAIEPLTIPFSWVLIATIILALAIATIASYLRESLTGKVSFFEQIEELFPHAAILRIGTKAGKHDIRLINDFTATFESPRLVSTFPVAGEYFEITSIADCNEDTDTPIILVSMGKTSLRELQNMYAIFGDELGIIVFEK